MNVQARQLKRIVAGIALVASISVLAAQPAAALDQRSPDTQAALGRTDVRSPDARDAAVTAVTSEESAVTDARPPDTRTAAELAGATGGSGQAIVVASTRGSVTDVRSPDARDASGPGTGEARTVAASSGSVDWADFGMGVGVAASSLLLLAGVAAAAMGGRRRNDPSTV